MANSAGQVTLLPPLTITGALTGWVTDQFKFNAAFPKVLTVQANFVYGSGGTTVKAWIQTSVDDGASWMDVICFALTTASGKRVAQVNNFVAITGAAVVTPTDATLADNTILNGVLGNRMRVKITSTGTYAGNTKLDLLANLR